MKKILINKINNRTGASLVTVLLAISLVSALAMFVSSQVINQIKSTSKRTNEIQLQYTSESGIERTIEELLAKVKSSETAYSVSLSKSRSGQSSYLDLIQQEIEGIIIKIDSVNTYELERAINDINYTSDIDSIILKLRNVRTELLNIVEDNTSQRSQIKERVDFNISKVCKAIDYANAEKNKNIEPIEFKGGNNPRDFIDYLEALTKLEGSKEVYGNSYDNIVIYMSIAKQEIDKVEAAAKVDETDKLVSLAREMHSLANSELKGKIQKYYNKFNVWNPSKEYQEIILKEAEEIFIDMDNTIERYLSNIRSIRKEIYQTYTYCMANYNSLKEEEFKKHTDKALEMYDSIEDQLRWFRKKLGSNKDASTDSPDTELPDDSNDDSTNNPDTEIPGEDDSDIDYIILEVYKDEFEVMNSIYEYEVKYEKDGEIVDEIRIPKNIQEYNLNIVSTATNNNKTYKIRATIILNLENGIQYSVDEYERINY